MDFPDLHLFLADRVLDGLRERIRRLAPRKLRDDELALLGGVDLRANLHLAEPVLVVADIHDAAELEVRIELERLPLNEVDLRLEKFNEVVRQNRGRKTDRDAVRAEHEEHRDLRRQVDGLLLASVIVRDEHGRLLVEDLLAGKLGQAALDVTCRRVLHSGVQGAVVALSVNEIALALAPKLVRENADRVADRRIAVRMVLHRVADDVRDLRVTSVVLLPQRMHDAPLHGLKSVLHRRNRTVADHVRRVLPEVEVVELLHRPGAREALRRGEGFR